MKISEETLNQSFKKDLYRYYGDRKRTIMDRIFMPEELHYIYYMRMTRDARWRILKYYYHIRLRMIQDKTQIQIPYYAEIGDGFYIGHCGRIIISPNAKIGKNVNVGTGVTIGEENRGKKRGAPIISENVWIGTNAVVVGNIIIDTDVLIAPLAYVNFDVPSHSIVIGNPGEIISRGGGATKEYITNMVD